GPDALSRAREILPSLPEISAALDELDLISEHLKDRIKICFDLTELRGTYYHTGLLFAVYADGWAGELARGGRYDNVGKKFGRSRPATGFSLDLRDLLRILPQKSSVKGIRVAAADRYAAASSIDALRSSGEVVVIDLLNESADSLNCDRQLVCRESGWHVTSLC
ncbi:MAG: ATP phosphoribosyltransferase regulatory subunit, partial [Candidatus Obscuribacterales bacterium]|nr:ATP phosphoribosyltransferase regulatory subunit [Candidatus Obscuribacterales bacterium]